MLTPSIRLHRRLPHRLRRHHLHQNHVVVVTLHHRHQQTLQSQMNQLDVAVRINIIINRAPTTNPNEMGIIAIIAAAWMV